MAIEMVEIPSGTFTMGSPSNEAEREDNEGPPHRVNLSAFYMGKYEVTQAQWRAAAGLPKVETYLNPDPSKFKGDNLPVEQVSWWDAIEFCARLSQATGRTYRLPSEAEWEYACRAGITAPFAFGENITTGLANYDGSYPYGSAPKGEYRRETTPVGSLGVANGFGLYDMHGNVAEWCNDWYSQNYDSQSSSANPTARVRAQAGSFAAAVGAGTRRACGRHIAMSSRPVPTTLASASRGFTADSLPLAEVLPIRDFLTKQQPVR